MDKKDIESLIGAFNRAVTTTIGGPCGQQVGQGTYLVRMKLTSRDLDTLYECLRQAAEHCDGSEG